MADTFLIVEDERNIRKSLRGILEDEGYSVDDVESGEEAIKAVRDVFYRIIFLDVLLPGIDGIKTLEKIKVISPESNMIMMSGNADFDMVINATRLGAYHFFEKPLIPEKIFLEIERINSRRAMETEVSELRKVAGWYEMIGSSPAMNELKKTIEKVAPTEGRVLIQGENGTGKELVARAIHFNSTRKGKPFVKINCAAIPKDLIESELFGYEKGAFTGAVNRKIGRIEEAHTGTLFLDEVGDMSLDTQARLLRVLEENELVRLGGSKSITFDVRIISATNQDLDMLIKEAKFREDLYHRLYHLQIQVPPLRERSQDIPQLIEAFTRQFADRNNKSQLKFDQEALQILSEQEWRGNVRELKNVIERIAIMSDSSVVKGTEVLKYAGGSTTYGDKETAIPEISGRPLKEIVEDFEKALLKREYDRCGGKISKVAKTLKVDRANLHHKLKRMGIK